MNRATLRRLEALEQKTPQDTGKWHTILVASDEEEEQQTAALKASSTWTEGDNLMVIRLVGSKSPRGCNEPDDVNPSPQAGGEGPPGRLHSEPDGCAVVRSLSGLVQPVLA